VPAAELAKPGKRRLVFDGDGSQFLDTGKPCTLCGRKATLEDVPPLIFIRVREQLEGGKTREIAHVCPDCVARMFYQVTKLKLWNQVSSQIMTAIRRLFTKFWGNVEEKKGTATPPKKRPALGSVPQPKLASRGLDKLLPPKE